MEEGNKNSSVSNEEQREAGDRMALPLGKEGFCGISDSDEDEAVIAAKTLVQMSRSKSTIDLIYSELCRLEWMGAKMKRDREEESGRKRKQALSIAEIEEEPLVKKTKVMATPERASRQKKKKEESAGNGMLPVVNLENGGLAQLARSNGPSFLTKKNRKGRLPKNRRADQLAQYTRPSFQMEEKKGSAVNGRLLDEKLENGDTTQLAYYTRRRLLKENKDEQAINGRNPVFNEGVAQLVSKASVRLFHLNLPPPEEDSME